MSLLTGGFHEVQLPPDISYGSSGGPGYSTNVITVDSGVEQRVIRWSEGRGQWNVAKGVQTQQQLYNLLTFFHARKGSGNGFRYKDWADFATTVDGTVNYGLSTSNIDVTIGTGDGTTTTFQLIKRYTSGPVTTTRTITKPVDGSVKIALDGVNQTTGWTVNTTNGIVTFSTAPGIAVVVSAGFEFDVPARFGEDVDKGLPTRLDDYNSGSIDVPVIEIKDYGQSADEFFYGGAIELLITGDYTISGIIRLWVFNTAGAHNIILPDISDMVAGGPVYYIINEGSATLTLKDDSLATVATILAGKGVTVLISINSIGEKTWYVK